MAILDYCNSWNVRRCVDGYFDCEFAVIIFNANWANTSFV